MADRLSVSMCACEPVKSKCCVLQVVFLQQHRCRGLQTFIQCAICCVSVRSLCDWLLVIRRQVDDLVALLSQDVQHAAVPQEVT